MKCYKCSEVIFEEAEACWNCHAKVRCCYNCVQHADPDCMKQHGFWGPVSAMQKNDCVDWIPDIGPEE